MVQDYFADTCETLEFSTQVGCPVNCKKYCPQELITTRYFGRGLLTLDALKRHVSTVPSNIPIVIAGVSEPFMNNFTAQMLVYLHEKGHKLALFTTLRGLSLDDAKIISRIPFEKIELHMPDSLGNSNIRMDAEWLSVLKEILGNVPNINFMSMNGLFVTNGSENMARDKTPTKRGKVTCNRLKTPNYVVQPNGEVFFCCMCRCLEERVGNIYESTYPELRSRHQGIAKRLMNDPKSICHRCSWSQPLWLYYSRKAISKLGGTIAWLQSRL